MAGKELAKARRKFVEMATKVLIYQLLDDLLHDGVLNQGQKDSIVEDNNTTANKARSLIDMVTRKGDVASRKMIDHLQTRDSSVHSELGLSSGQPALGLSSGQPALGLSSGQPALGLSSGQPALGLSSGQPAQPAAEPQKQQEWSTRLIRTREDSWKKKQDDDVYPVAENSKSNRVALIITNMKFTDEKLNRNGAEKDEKNMVELLRALGYEVVKHTNLTGKLIDDAVIEFSKHPKLKEADSVMVVIMSHGKLGAILGVDWKKEISDDEKPDVFPIDNIYKHLGPQRCPALLNKPKIIIIQACRGEEKGSVLVRDGANPAVVSDAPGEENIEDDGLRFVNQEKDYISLLSCTPDTVSYRHKADGSFLIRYVVEVLNTFAHKDDIEELFRKVMKRFEDLPLQEKKQMPTKDRCTLTKRFYFVPGL